MGDCKVVILVSSLSADEIQKVNSNRLETALKGKRLVYEKVDGALPENKELRDKLFHSSSLRGKYPQCFICTGDELRFIGMWEDIESLLDSDSIPKEILDANPGIPTFSKVTESNPKCWLNILSLSLLCFRPFPPFLERRYEAVLLQSVVLYFFGV